MIESKKTIRDTNSLVDTAILILKSTKDGDELEPMHFWLVTLAVNGQLSEAGAVALRELAANVAGGYKAPWLHGHENLLKDHKGFVYWRGVQVEHYTFSSVERERDAAAKLALMCQRIEKAGGRVNGFGSVMNEWRKADAEGQART